MDSEKITDVGSKQDGAETKKSGWPENFSDFLSHMLGVYLFVLTAIMVYLLLKLWPNVISDTNGAPDKWVDSASLILFGKFQLSNELRLLAIVITSGGIGSMLHALKSYVEHMGNRAFQINWMWWYILRLPIGGTLALVFYLSIRAGILSNGSGSDNLSVFGVAGIASLVGLFSEQATNKLKEVFDTLFTSQKVNEKENADL
ncbi:MAG: hypothetical protein JEZ12_03320 [Desulfobacterium sp.]|nr:hypothetical protein [Desulfobacterium sp.]